MKILNCRVFRCKFNEKGNCRLEKITLQDVGSLIIGNVVCIEAEPKEDDARLNSENTWGESSENMHRVTKQN